MLTTRSQTALLGLISLVTLAAACHQNTPLRADARFSRVLLAGSPELMSHVRDALFAQADGRVSFVAQAAIDQAVREVAHSPSEAWTQNDVLAVGQRVDADLVIIVSDQQSVRDTSPSEQVAPPVNTWSQCQNAGDAVDSQQCQNAYANEYARLIRQTLWMPAYQQYEVQLEAFDPRAGSRVAGAEAVMDTSNLAPQCDEVCARRAATEAAVAQLLANR